MFPVKMIRVLTLVPGLDSKSHESDQPDAEMNGDTHAAILELMDMLSEEEESELDEELT